MIPLAGKTLFVSGGSRGIGLAIALRAAREGANVAIAAKTVEPHPKLPGPFIPPPRRSTRPAATRCRSPATSATRLPSRPPCGATVERFGGIDILVNNASAISLTGTAATPMKRFDLMFDVNVRGTFACSRPACRISETPQPRDAIRTSSRCRRRSTSTPSGSAATSPTRWRNTA
jgi:citronellol/citronellal dehydrogenase